MNSSFEKKITTYNAALKESLKDMSKQGREQAKEVKESLNTEFAREQFTDTESESKIYDIQKQKLERLNKFKKFLHKTRGENGSFIHPEIDPELPLVKQTESGSYVVTTPLGSKTITKGELLTDHEWGLEYTFDSSVNIHDVRSYYFARLKSDLREKLDRQIITSEVANQHGDTFKQHAYREIGKTIENGNEQQGVIAEKMVRNFLKKISIDHNADFEIVEANAYQDVEQKVDFIIHRKSNDKLRGAQVTESDHATDIGIQFTINTAKTDFKEKQIAKAKRRAEQFDDIVLVTLPANDASVLHKKWSFQKTAGGPEKLWNKQVQEAIFRGVMTKVYSDEEIDRWCEEYFRK